MSVRRNKGYIEVDFLGEARIINGRSHRVSRIRGVLRGSGRKREDIGVMLFNRGTVSKVIKKEDVRQVAVLCV